MQLTITINDKTIKNAIDYFVESNVYDQYNSQVLKRAGVPKKTELVKQLVADEKFIAQLGKGISNYFDDDVLYDVFADMQGDAIDKVVEKCEDAEREIYEEEYAKEEAMEAKHAAARATEEAKRKEAEEEATVARVVMLLKKQGYKIEKA